MVLDDTGSVYGDTGWYLVVLGQYKLVPGGTGSLWGCTGWPMVVLGRYGVVLAGTWWYWVTLFWYCLELSVYILYKYILKQVEIWSGVTDP